MVIQVATLVALAAMLALGAARLRLSSEALTDLAVGRSIVESGAVPARDPLSWAAGDTAWIASSWLGQIAAFAAWRAGGLRGAALLHGALLAGAAAGVVALARRRTRGWAAQALASAGALGGLLATTPTLTGAWSVLLLAWALVLVERLRVEARWREAAALGGALAASAQLDSGFVAPFAAVLALALMDLSERRLARAKMLGAAFSLGAASFLLHPSGVAAAAHPLEYFTAPRLRELFWNVPGLGGTDFTSTTGKIVEVPLLVLLGLALTRRFTPRRSDVLLVLVFAHAAFTLERAVPFLLVVLAGPLAAALDEAWPSEEERRSLSGAALALGAGLVGAALVSGPSLLDEQKDALAVAERVAALETPGELWNELDAGGALAWRLEGRRRVWIDSRHDLHAASGVWRKHTTIAAARPPWNDLVDRTRTNMAIAKRDGPLHEALRERSWTVTLETPALVLLVRPGL